MDFQNYMDFAVHSRSYIFATMGLYYDYCHNSETFKIILFGSSIFIVCTVSFSRKAKPVQESNPYFCFRC